MVNGKPWTRIWALGVGSEWICFDKIRLRFAVMLDWQGLERISRKRAEQCHLRHTYRGKRKCFWLRGKTHRYPSFWLVGWAILIFEEHNFSEKRELAKENFSAEFELRGHRKWFRCFHITVSLMLSLKIESGQLGSGIRKIPLLTIANYFLLSK